MNIAKPLPPLSVLFDRYYVDSTSPSGLRNRVTLNRATAKKDEPAGRLQPNGYYQLGVNGSHYYAHRIILAMRTGVDRPDMYTDHKDRNNRNNHPFNLRWTTYEQNNANKTKVLRHSPQRKYPKGVSRLSCGGKKPYRARATVNGKMTYLGVFATAQEASEAVELAYSG
tara:strand:+ start:1700 stop:2206 length:507 start_codon:yes stop_codon:yes gene_type:complete